MVKEKKRTIWVKMLRRRRVDGEVPPLGVPVELDWELGRSFIYHNYAEETPAPKQSSARPPAKSRDQ